MPEDEKLNRNTSKKVEVKQDARKTMDISNSRLYHEITVSS